MQMPLLAPTAAARVCVYAGYSFGVLQHAAACGFGEYLTGLVVTPRWVPRMVSELQMVDGAPPDAAWSDDSPTHDAGVTRYEAPGLAERIILDNGAFPAWRRGEVMTLGEQLDGLHKACELVEPEWIVAPDVVADPHKTWARLCACQLELEQYGLDRLLLPVQDGMNMARVAAMARDLRCGIFVGGSGWRFKRAALVALRDEGVRWVHVGRARSASQLEACAELGADSCDSSSWLRAQHNNVARRDTYRRALVEYAHRRPSPVDEDTSPPLVPTHQLTTADLLGWR